MAGLCVCLLLALAGGCTDEPEQAPSPPATSASVRAALTATALIALNDAVSAGDTPAAEDLAANDEARTLLAGIVANAEALAVEDFTLRYVDQDATLTASLPEGQWAAAVDTGWRFRGFDSSSAGTEVTFTFAERDGRAVLVDVGGGERRTPLWLSAPLRVHRDADTLVLVDGPADVLRRYRGLAEGAVPVVRRVLPRWRDGLVVEVPASPEALDATLGASPGEYAAIAAVTSTVDGTQLEDAPVHVFVNPRVFGALKPQGAQIVMSHEAVHVATDAVLARMPLWLLEGFADYVALRDVRLPLSVTAGQVLAQVRRDGAPAQLPTTAEFDTGTTHLGATYEGAWLACRLLARLGGEADLVALYRRASRGEDAEALLRELFGIGLKEFTARWRTELETLAG